MRHRMVVHILKKGRKVSTVGIRSRVGPIAGCWCGGVSVIYGSFILSKSKGGPTNGRQIRCRPRSTSLALAIIALTGILLLGTAGCSISSAVDRDAAGKPLELKLAHFWPSGHPIRPSWFNHGQRKLKKPLTAGLKSSVIPRKRWPRPMTSTTALSAGFVISVYPVFLYQRSLSGPGSV